MPEDRLEHSLYRTLDRLHEKLYEAGIDHLVEDDFLCLQHRIDEAIEMLELDE